MNPNIAVTARDLTRSFGDFVAVDHVSFEVKEGEIFGFLGPNGAGKTTTIKMLAGLLRPSSGEGSVAGLDIAVETEAIKRNIGYMSQLFSLYGDLTVDENITFFSRLYGVPGLRRAERRDWVLQIAGLTEQRDRLTSELPLGWKQRLALGCAVLHEPPILFLDEPTSGVDPISRRNFWELIYTLAERGTTVFVTTHYMEEAEYCHRLALMNRGRLIALDTPANLRAELNGASIRARGRRQSRSRSCAPRRSGDSGSGFVRPGGPRHAERERKTQRSGSENDSPHKESSSANMSRIEPSLEDVFAARVRAEGGAPVN